MVQQLLESFALGSGAILTNVCMLPLYPGLIAFLAGNVQNERSRRVTGFLGALVLAGVLTMMLFISLVIYLLNQAIGSVLIWLLPLIYAVVILFGLLLLAGVNPFTRLSTAQIPVLKNPFAAAYVYGLLLGPMTLPCTGPFIVGSVFIVGTASVGGFLESMLNFLAFGLGFGWPLVLLPLLAVPFQRRLVGWLARNHALLTRVSGLLLLAVGIFGLIWDWLPGASNFTVEPGEGLSTVYWLVVAVVIAGFIALWLRRDSPAAHAESSTAAG